MRKDIFIEEKGEYNKEQASEEILDELRGDGGVKVDNN